MVVDGNEQSELIYGRFLIIVIPLYAVPVIWRVH